jgi:hypothetical protein
LGTAYNSRTAAAIADGIDGTMSTHSDIFSLIVFLGRLMCHV